MTAIWTTTTIGSLLDDNVIRVSTGFASGEHNDQGIGVPHMRPFNVSTDGRISLEQIKSVAPPTDSDRLLERGDVLFNNTNTAELVGKTAYWDSHNRYAYSNHMTRVRVIRADRAVPRFLAFALHREWAAGQAQRLCRQHVAQASIIGERFREMEVAFPDVAVQRLIAAVLSLVQLAIENEEKAIVTTRELKHAALEHVFTRGLHAETQRETEIGPVPASWQVLPMADLREFLQYGTSTKCDYGNSGHAVLRIPNVIDGRIDSSDLKRCTLVADTARSLLLEPGDVLFIRTNGVRARVGTCAVYEGDPADALFASYLIRARPKPLLNPNFFQYYTATPLGASFLGGRASPASDGKFNVNTKTIDGVLVPVPPRPDQDEIVGHLRKIDAALRIHERRRAALSDLFGTLLNKLMTGEIRVDDLEIDTSAVEAA